MKEDLNSFAQTIIYFYLGASLDFSSAESFHEIPLTAKRHLKLSDHNTLYQVERALTKWKPLQAWPLEGIINFDLKEASQHNMPTDEWRVNVHMTLGEQD